MKSLSSLRLGAVVLLAACHLDAADPPTLISQPAVVKPKETLAQMTARQDQEFAAVERKVNALVKELPLLAGPGWEENYGKFRAGLAALKDEPQFKRKVPVAPKFEPGKPLPAPRTLAQTQQERRTADLALMRAQAEKVLEKQPELRDYIEQYFQWHKRLFELQDQCPGNAKVRRLVQNRLEVVAVPAGKAPAPAQ